MKIKYSNINCSYPGCIKKLKLKFTETKNHSLCYKHFCITEALRNHYVNTSQRRKRVEAMLPVKASLNSPTGVS